MAVSTPPAPSPLLRGRATLDALLELVVAAGVAEAAWVVAVGPGGEETVAASTIDAPPGSPLTADTALRGVDGDVAYRSVPLPLPTFPSALVVARPAREGPPPEAAAEHVAGLVAHALRASLSERLLESTFRLSVVPLMLLDAERREVVSANAAAAALYGCTEDALRGLHITDFHHPDDFQALQGILAHPPTTPVRPGGPHPGATWRHLRRDGTVVHVHIIVTPLDLDGRRVHLVQVDDRTDSVHVEASLTSARRREQTLMEAVGDAVLVLSDEGTVLAANQRAGQVYGVEPADIVGRSAADYVTEPGFVERLRRVVHERVRDERQTVHLRPDGRRLDVRVGAAPYVFEGRPAALITVLDETPYRVAERAIGQRDRVLLAVSAVAEILLASPDPLTKVSAALACLGEATDVSRVYVFENDVGSAPLTTSQRYEWVAPGVTEEIDNPDLQGLPYVAGGFVDWPERLTRREAIYGPVESFTDEVRTLLEAQDIRSIAIVPIIVEDEWWGFLGCDACHQAREWSEAEVGALRAAANVLGSAIVRGRAQETLRLARDRAEEARQQAETAARLQASFLANMSHEIRTPLTAIIGFAELLAFEVPAECQDLVGPIDQGGRRLLATLDSVLDFTQIEAGTYTLSVEPVDVAAAAREVQCLFRARAASQGLALTVDAPDALPALADGAALDRALANLVGNAVKFTPEGSVALTVRAEGDAAVVTVTDSGVGIDPVFLPHLFHEFRQESEGEGRAFEGNGLGLAITHRLVTAMGGTIGVESEKGRGTTFTVTLPLATGA